MFLKIFSIRYNKTSKMSTEAIKRMIAERERVSKPCGVLYKVLADRSDKNAATHNIDPPRPGRKTYSQRYAETSALTPSQIRAKIAEREAVGKECGVLYRVLSDKT